VYLKVSPTRGLRRFKVRDKLTPRFIGPVKIMEKRGEVAYELELLSQLADVQNVFHVSCWGYRLEATKIPVSRNHPRGLTQMYLRYN
jgi:hypothetical protein